MPRFVSENAIEPVRDGEHMVLYIKALKNTLKQQIQLQKKFYFKKQEGSEELVPANGMPTVE